MKNIFYTIAAACILSTTSSEHKNLCYDHAHTGIVNVVFDWRNAPNAAPKSMSCYLFPTDGGEVLRYEFTDRNGGAIRVPAGRYDALCLNSDTENISYRNTETKNGFEVTTRTTALLSDLAALGVRSSGAPRAAGTESERVVLSPDMLWSDHAEGIELKATSATQTVTLYPEVSVSRYTVEIHNAENLKYVSGISGSISSLAGGLLAGKAETTEECVTIPFDATFSPEQHLNYGAAARIRALSVGAEQTPADRLCGSGRPKPVVLHLRRDGSDSFGPESTRRTYRFGRAAAAETHRQRRRFPAHGRRVAGSTDRYRNVTVSLFSGER